MITMNEKDADFIAQYARKELENCHNSYEKAVKEVEKKKKMADLISELFSEKIENNSEISEAKDDFYKSFEEGMTGMKQVYTKEIDTLNKIIQLCVAGSEGEVS